MITANTAPNGTENSQIDLFERHSPEPEVYAIHGVEPEVQAYAMAKYSRSALSMKESIRNISQQRAEKFLNTFYFQYGHRSIADLAHIALAMEGVSLLAAIEVVDEPRWDGQERSTRYQNFKKRRYYAPPALSKKAAEVYRDTAQCLFRAYEMLSESMFNHLQQRLPRLPEMAEDAYFRTLRARAFDVARYLLPLCTYTSLGQVVNARTLEAQISRLLSDGHAEIRHIGELLKRTARSTAYDPAREEGIKLVEEMRQSDSELADLASDLFLRPVHVAPTLVKYAERSEYRETVRREMADAAVEMMKGTAVQSSPAVDFLDDEDIEIELATTLLYEHCDYPYRQIRSAVEALGEKRRREIINLGVRGRSKHDELLRPFCAGQKFRFDILMDIGGFRDLHRHRRCIQIGQRITAVHGYEVPTEVKDAGEETTYHTAMHQACKNSTQLARMRFPEAKQSAQYLIPLGCRKRTLFAMDFAEVVYIADLRTTPAGHFSYRTVAYEMYRTTIERHPGLACLFRVQDPSKEVDLLMR